MSIRPSQLFLKKMVILTVPLGIIYSAFFYWVNLWIPFTAAGLFTVASLIVILVYRQGYFKLASLLICFNLLAAVYVSMFPTGAFNSPLILWLIPPVILVGMILNKVWVSVFTGISLLLYLSSHWVAPYFPASSISPEHLINLQILTFTSALGVIGYSAYLNKIYQEVYEREGIEETTDGGGHRMGDAQFLSRLVENIPSIVFVKDIRTRKLVRMNQMGLDVLGLQKKDVLGKTDHDLFPKEQADFFIKKDQEVIAQKGLVVTPEETILSKSKGARTLYTKKIPILDSNGSPRYLLGISEDITERIQLEKKIKARTRQLELAKQMAVEANETKSRFLANVSHEIRTPLAAVIGYSEMITSSLYTADEKKSFTRIIHRNGQLLQHLINDLLDLSRIEAGHIEIEMARVDLHELPEEVKVTFESKFKSKGLTFNLAVSPKTPRYILSDPHRLRQILFNLIGNALKFTQEGEITLEVRSEANENDLHRICFSVKDTGQGISPQSRESIFDSFVQEDMSTHRVHGGAGLGLALSRQLARALHGDLRLTHTEKGRGSTFELTILAKALNEPCQQPLGESSQNASLTANRVLKDRTVLVVDDSPEMRGLVQLYLKNSGCKVIGAQDGQEGIKLASQHPIDLVLMDLQMPGMDGFQALKRLKQCGFNRPIIALTGHALQEDRIKSLEAGFSGHLTKPIQRSTLLNQIEQALKNSPLAALPPLSETRAYRPMNR